MPIKLWECISVTILLCAFICAEAYYMTTQSLWTDELTQLHGIRLPFTDMFSWLLHYGNPGPVPFDRSPPLSYILDWLWSLIFGSSTISLRCFSLLITSTALFVCWRTARLYIGNEAAVVFLILMVSSPNILSFGTEIRAYPLFFLCSALAAYHLISLKTQPTPKRLLLLGLSLAGAITTHFFGLVLAFAVLSTYLIAVPLKASIQSISTRLLLPTLLALLSIIPFIHAAINLSESSEATTNPLTGIARLAYRLIGHTAFMIYPLLFGLFLTSLVLIILVAVYRRSFQPRNQALIILPLIFGFASIVCASYLLHSFEASSSSYNVWMLPFVFLALATFFNETSNLLIRLSLLITVLTSLGAGTLYIYHSSYFRHGPYEWFVSLVCQYPPGNTALIYDHSSGQAGMAAIALDALQPATYAQYFVDKATFEIRPFRSVNHAPQSFDSTHFDYLVLASVKALSATEVIKSIRVPLDETHQIAIPQEIEGQPLLQTQQPGWSSIAVKILKIGDTLQQQAKLTFVGDIRSQESELTSVTDY